MVKLPSNREIARKFGVSQPTVVKALQELVREEYLTIRPGVGAFSNPDRFTHDSKLWGIVLGDGRWSQFSRETLHVINSVGMALLEHDHRNLLKLITMGETMDDERGWPELSMLSGICWWIPTDPLLPSMARSPGPFRWCCSGTGNPASTASSATLKTKTAKSPAA